MLMQKQIASSGPESGTGAASHRGKTLGPSPARPRATCGPNSAPPGAAPAARSRRRESTRRAVWRAAARHPTLRESSAITLSPRTRRAADICASSGGCSEEHAGSGARAWT